jgi:hypothetical protein
MLRISEWAVRYFETGWSTLLFFTGAVKLRTQTLLILTMIQMLQLCFVDAEEQDLICNMQPAL